MFHIPGMNMKVNIITHLQLIFLHWIGFFKFSVFVCVCAHGSKMSVWSKNKWIDPTTTIIKPFYWTILLLTPDLQPDLSSVFTHNRTHTMCWDEQDG